MSSGELPAVIREQRLIAVARGVTGDTAAVLAEALMDGGIGILEITVEEEAGMGALARLKGSDLLIGAGTVTAIGQAAAAIDAGASFLVSPHHDPSLSAWAANRGVPFIAGALTPTEIHAAWDSSVAAVKVFPASVGGPDLIRAVKAPFPDIDLIPTGRCRCRQCEGVPRGRRHRGRCWRLAHVTLRPGGDHRARRPARGRRGRLDKRIGRRRHSGHAPQLPNGR